MVPSARVATSTDTMVEALDSGANISFDAAATGYQGNQTQTDINQGESRRRRTTDPGANRLFTASTQAFAAIFEGGSADKSGKNADRLQSRVNGTPVSRIINTYETNALVITGQQPVRGTSFSFNL